MTDRRKQLRVGIFAIITAALLGVVLLVFGGLQFWKHHDHYDVVFDDSVLGLNAGAPVYLNGIEVGTVTGVHIAPDDLSKVRVALSVDVDTPIHVDTHAFLSMAGLTGIRSIDLKGGSYASPRLAQNGIIAAGQGTLDKLEAKAVMLADESGKLMLRANEIVDGANRVMTNLTTATDPVALQAILDNTRKTSANLADASKGVIALVGETRVELAHSLASVNGAASGAEAVTRSAQAIIDKQVTGLVDNATALVSDLRGVIHGNEIVVQAATADLRQASRSLKDLAREVRQKPSRLLFSNSQPDRKMP